MEQFKDAYEISLWGDTLVDSINYKIDNINYKEHWRRSGVQFTNSNTILFPQDTTRISQGVAVKRGIDYQKIRGKNIQCSFEILLEENQTLKLHWEYDFLNTIIGERTKYGNIDKTINGTGDWQTIVYNKTITDSVFSRGTGEPDFDNGYVRFVIIRLTDNNSAEFQIRNIKLEIPNYSYYEEEKIGVIGSDSMTAQWRAVEPKLTQNVNGTNTFTFKMFYTYIDTITGERKDNPFQNLLVNERKVKVKWKDKWYDFVIKSCQEDSSGKSVTYTCQDQFINELSKTGFSLEFDNELGNNMGTAQELARTVLDGTDWQLGENQDTIKQYREEPVYDISDTWTDNEQVSHNIRFLVFYSVVQNHETYFQYWYDSSNQYTRDGTSMLVVNGECKSTTASWSEDTATVTIEGHSMEIDFASLNVSDDYRAKRLVRTQETAYCPALDRYVSKYTYDNDTKVAYGYQTTVYNDPLTVRNIITNGKDFTEALGWSNHVTIPWQIYPPYTASTDVATYDGKSHLGLQTNIKTYNSAIADHLSSFSEGAIKGQKYVLRLKARGGSASSPENNYLTQGFDIFVGKFTRSQSGEYSYNGNNYVDVSRLSHDSENHWITYILTFVNSITRSEIGNNFGLIITSNTNKKKEGSNNIVAYNYAWIQEIEFFEYIESGNSYIIPGEVDTSGVVKTEWCYFDESQLNVINADDIEYLDYSEEPISTYNPFYGNDDSGAEKVRSISGKNSNRFNWLQTIAETFECWVKFDIKHNNDGTLIYDSDIPRKEVTFVNDIGNQTGLSFIYGIDLNTISRTINSDQIATKVIVSPNSNEFGQDGFCTIARSDENYSKTNFILDFGYYINQGMLSSGQVNLDLYDSAGNGIGYYYFLRQLNTQYDGYNEQYVDISSQLDRYESQKNITEKQIKSTEEEINYLKNRLVNLITSQTSWNEKVIGQKVKNEYANDQSVQQAWTGYISSKNNLASYRNLLTALETQIDELEDQIEEIETNREGILEDIAALDEKFNTKYARFIQEGSWISEDYYDDNLYYLDAESVAYTSSRPQIQYNINVLRLSALEEFKNKIFNVGDRGYVEDTEFFGYAKDVNGNITNTPYKEEILISEITSVFDSPEQDTITVQNYKTQFEDLFQRITATTQSLQYNEGGYARAASIVEPTGEINSWTLAKSFEYNEQLAWRATDDSIVINTTGVTAVDTTNPQNMVRLSSAGLQISSDGGVTWTTGVSGAGISTQNLTAGSINTDNVQILSGSYPTFTWNKYGLNAYYYTTNQGTINSVYSNTFVRFDRYGLYGIQNVGENGTEYIPESEDDVWEDANFAVTWRGFKLRTDSGAVTITSDNEIQVWDDQETPINRIKIGRISGQGTEQDPYMYGIYIRDEAGNTVLKTEQEGKLWLRDALYIGNSNNNNIAIGNLPNDPYVYGYDEITVEGSFIEGKTYYEYDENTNTYYVTQDLEPDQNKIYYEQVGQVFNANNNFIMYDNGSIIANNGTFNNGTFSGTLQGATGTFSGDISAATGRFSGEIEASIGNIGGFTIGSTSLYSLKDENNGIILMSGPSYVPTIDIEKQEGKTYYYVDEEDGSYKVFEGSTFEQGKEYYELYVDQSINAYNNFIIHNDGSIEAKKGIFSGNLEAAEGTFAGDISAASGTIGGFQIANNQLISTDNEQSIQLNGLSGTIIANKITLGIGAEIDNYLKLGSAYIYNPNIEGRDNLLISAGSENIGQGYLKIYDNGIMNLGDITIDGSTSNITLIDSDLTDDIIPTIVVGNNVTITPNRSEFKDVDITGTLHTSIFEVGKIQAVGGAMIFKESAELNSLEKTEGINTYIFTTKTPINLEANSIVLFTNKTDSTVEIYGTIQQSEDEYVEFEGDSFEGNVVYYELINEEYVETEDAEKQEGKTYYIKIINYVVETLTPLSSNFNNYTILQIADFDSVEEKYSNNLIIGINSQSSKNKMLYPEALTMIDAIGINKYGSHEGKPNLLLGNLSSLQLDNITGYGLYGNNVYLTGSLVTEVEHDDETETTYAGVNTRNGVNANIFNDKPVSYKDQSRIVFWAGAESNKDDDIKDSPFQVTEDGSFYARQGYFTGSIITEASITAATLTASKLYTIDIYGGTESEAAALTIHDAAKGIIFVSDEKQYDLFDGDSFIEGVTYYELDNEEYIETSDITPQENKSYYVKNLISTELLRIGNKGFYSNDNQNNFIKIDNNIVDFLGDTFNTKPLQNSSNYLTLKNDKILGKQKGTEVSSSDLETGIISLNTNFDISFNNISKMLIKNDEGMDKTTLSSQIVNINKEVHFGDKMKYQQVNDSNSNLIGYDLYVS